MHACSLISTPPGGQSAVRPERRLMKHRVRSVAGRAAHAVQREELLVLRRH